MGAKSVTASSSKKIKNRHNGKVKKSKKINEKTKKERNSPLLFLGIYNKRGENQ